MKPQAIYEKYLSKEYSVNDFLYHMRRNPMLKEHISPVNTAEDIISILKSRNLIWEQQAPTPSDPFDAFKAFAKNAKNEDYENSSDDADVDDVESRGTSVNERINQKDYKYYVCQIISPKEMNICEGFEYQEDAADRKKEIKREGNTGNFKIFSKRYLVSKGVNPDDDKHWKDPVDVAGDFSKDEGTNDYDKYQFQSGETYKEEIGSDDPSTKAIIDLVMQMSQGDVKKAQVLLLSTIKNTRSNKSTKEIDVLKKALDILIHGQSDHIDAIKTKEPIKEEPASEEEMGQKLANIAMMKFKNDEKQAIAFLMGYAEHSKDQKNNVYIQKAIELLKNHKIEPPSNINEEAKAVEKKPVDITYKGDANLGNVTKGTNKRKITADQVNYYEFSKGWKYEANIPLYGNITKEDANKAKEKAIKNLIKDPAYYSNLFAKEGMATLGAKPLGMSLKMGDITTPVDKKNGMVPVKGAKVGASSGGSSKQMKATEKMRNLKEVITKEIKKMIKEDAGYNGNIVAMQQMAKMKPEDLAKQVLNGFGQMTPLRKEFAGKVLGKAIADGNTDQTVADAFHKISDDINIKKESGVEEKKSPLSGAEEKTAKHIKPALASMEKEYGDKKGKGIFYATVRKDTNEGDMQDSSTETDSDGDDSSVHEKTGR